MNNSDLIDVIAEATRLPKATAKKVLGSVLSSIMDALKKGEAVSLIGFGTFSVRHRKARKGRNPKTGAALEIAPSQVAWFKAGKSLREIVQGE